MDSCRHCRLPISAESYCCKICKPTSLHCQRIVCNLEGDNVQHVGDFCYRIERDEDDFPEAITIQQKSAKWKETYTRDDTRGMWSLPWDARSQERVQRFLEAATAILPRIDEYDGSFVEEIGRATFVLIKESDMYPFSTGAVWLVNQPPQILKWMSEMDEGSITDMLARKPNLSTVKVFEVFAALYHPLRKIQMPAIFMKHYPTTGSKALATMPAGDDKMRTILHLCCAVLVELARIQQTFHYFQHGDLHFGNVFIDPDAPNVALDEIGAPPFPLGRPVIGDFGRSTLNYVIKQKRGSSIVPITAWHHRPLPPTEDAERLVFSANLSSQYAFKSLGQFVQPIVTADASLELARDLWAFRNEQYPTIH